jgi:hypothetical protein
MSGRSAAIAAACRYSDAIMRLTGTAGRAVRLDGIAVLDRSDAVALSSPGAASPNGACRLLAAADGWVAVNLPRADDIDLVPAWIGCGFHDPVWPAIAVAARAESALDLVRRGSELGLAVAVLGEVAPPSNPVRLHRLAEAYPLAGKRHLRVLDLSSLWAGPLCAGILAAAGHEVLKVESRTRPDPVRLSAPAQDVRLNGAKRRLSIDFVAQSLEPLMAGADVIVTSARPRAFAALGLAPEELFVKNPNLLWVAITAHGWTGAGAMRTGFGDDAAVAGGLVDWIDDAPLFAGDALADPLSGLAAGVAALEAMAEGGGVLVDVAMARVAAYAAGER